MKPFPGGMQSFMKQYNQLQSKMKKLQEELELREFSSQAGGGAISVIVKNKKISSIKISKELMESHDTEMLQDLILTSVNEALIKAHETSEQEIEKLTGGVSLPGLF